MGNFLSFGYKPVNPGKVMTYMDLYAEHTPVNRRMLSAK